MNIDALKSKYFVYFNNSIPKEIKEKYYNGNLDLNDIRKYKDILKEKDIKIGSKNNIGVQNLIKLENIFGSVLKYIKDYPKEIDVIFDNKYILKDNDYFYGTMTLNDLEKLNKKTIISIMLRLKNINGDLFLDIDHLVEYIKYLSLEEIIPNEDIRNFLLRCGIDNIYNFNNKNNHILDLSNDNNSFESSLIGNMYRYDYDKEDIKNKSEEELRVYLSKIIANMRGNFTELFDKYNEKLFNVFPDSFLDYNLLDELISNYSEEEKNFIKQILIQGFNGEIHNLLEIVNKYPVLLKVLENKNIVVDYSCDHYDRRFTKMIKSLGVNKFLLIAKDYGLALDFVASSFIDEGFDKLINKINSEDYNNIIDKALYDLIGSENIDVRTLPNSFKTKHPDLYISEDAPKELLDKFYDVNNVSEFINPRDLFEHPEWAKYLKNIDLNKCFEKISVSILKDGKRGIISIYKALYFKFSQEEILEFFIEYGEILYGTYTELNFNLNLDKDEFKDSIIKQFYECIIRRKIRYFTKVDIRKLPKSFKIKYPDLFLSDDAPKKLQYLFYSQELCPAYIKNNSGWIEYLKDKKLELVFLLGGKIITTFKSVGYTNEYILNIMKKYGDCLEACDIKASQLLDKANLDKIIIEQIIKSIKEPEFIPFNYNEDSKDILINYTPELFLSDDAPKELKKHFYKNSISFKILREHKEWLPYLKDKDVLPHFLHNNHIYCKGIIQLFQKYGQEQALNIGIKNPDSVRKMLDSDNFDLLNEWYEKLNFIPNHVVMLEFPINQSDKFVSSSKKWSKLMQIDKYNLNDDSKSALLKASMCFGVFDNDDEGYNKILELFTGIPKTIDSSEMYRIKKELEDGIYLVNDKKYKKKLEVIENSYIKSNRNYILRINPQDNKEDAKIIREILECYNYRKILTPDLAHKIFGGFIMKYDADFRDFLLKNMDLILSSDEYISYISSMQKQWKYIKVLNSNRVLTLDLALSFVKSNQYDFVEVGNEKLAEVSSQAGYSKDDFSVLQQIYDYGKARVFSSIPRVSGKSDNYVYEVLRLDDPLALVIGTLTDCCQKLGDAAASCMEHSMVDKHGRIFVIKDNKGNIVAQSWMWRNGNVICFDNIEIPSRAFTRAKEENLSREEFSDKIYNLYKLAGEELIKKDEYEYSKLLKSGKITQNQYDNLRLQKVTVGKGYNDILESLKRNAKVDYDSNIRPLSFIPPIDLKQQLYTADSQEQYIITGKKDIPKTKLNTPTIYQDEFIIYDKNNFKEKEYIHLQRLYKKTTYEEYITNDEEDFISRVAYNYNINDNNIKIIMNANFAIIYEDSNDKNIISDILYNTDIIVNNEELDITDKVVMQIRNALEQINKDKRKIDINKLYSNKLDIYNRAISLNKEIDEERGYLLERRKY